MIHNFAENSVMALPRTKFKCPHNHKTTGNTGDLIPIYRKEIIPGDIINMDVRSLILMTTPNFQTMDIAFADVAFYFVPNRLLWEHWKAFQGEKTVGPHETQPQYTVPQVTAPSGGWGENTIADYLGFPTKVPNIQVSALYGRAYALIWNEWYRDQNRQDFTDFVTDDANITGTNGDNYVTDPIGYGKCLKVAKIHDYFTSTLLQPQAGDPVQIGLGDFAPVIGNGNTMGFAGYDGTKFYNNLGLYATDSGGQDKYNGRTGYAGTKIGTTTSSTGVAMDDQRTIGLSTDPELSGVVADLSKATMITVNQLRQAFQLQKVLEANARSGTRYVEILKNRWNVTPSDARLQRPEYLGGKRFPLDINMVVQTSSTDSTSPLGQIAGFSHTENNDHYFTKGFEEHGILMGFVYIRHQRTYQQGLPKMFTRKNMEDYYMPEFQNLGEQPVYNYEIYAQGTDQDYEVFGYQEYGADYRYEQNRVSGQFRSNATNSFDNWHYADDYDSCPVNNEDWIVENGTSVDRTLTVTSDVVNQFYFDFYFDETDVRSVTAHSIPGFIDHH